jgi:hypothetical protein
MRDGNCFAGLGSCERAATGMSLVAGEEIHMVALSRFCLSLSDSLRTRSGRVGQTGLLNVLRQYFAV